MARVKLPCATRQGTFRQRRRNHAGPDVRNVVLAVRAVPASRLRISTDYLYFFFSTSHTEVVSWTCWTYWTIRGPPEGDSPVAARSGSVGIPWAACAQSRNQRTKPDSQLRVGPRLVPLAAAPVHPGVAKFLTVNLKTTINRTVIVDERLQG